MYSHRTRHGSMSNLISNPQTSSKASSRMHVPNIEKDNINVIESRLKQRSSLLPKIHPPIKTNTTNNQFFDSKKAQKGHTKELMLAISKYNLHRGEYAKTPFNELSYDLMKVMHCFSMVQNNFQELFQHLYEDFKQFLFMTTNAQLVEKYQVKEGELYKKIVEDIDVSVNKKLKESYNKIREVIDAKDEIELEYSRFRSISMDKEKKYLEKIEWLKKISNEEYAKYLQQKIQQKDERIEELEQSERSLVRLRDEYEKQIQKQQDQIQDQIQQISRLNTVIFDMKLGKSQSQKIILKLRDRFDQFNLKMIGIKEIIEIVQKENQDLKTERVALIRRAAVSFGQLTPRPKYKKVFNLTQKEQLMTLKPTLQLVEVLLNKVGNQFFTSPQLRSQMFDHKLSSKKDMHPKLEHAQKIRQMTLSSIAQSKHELKEISKIFMLDKQ